MVYEYWRSSGKLRQYSLHQFPPVRRCLNCISSLELVLRWELEEVFEQHQSRIGDGRSVTDLPSPGVGLGREAREDLPHGILTGSGDRPV